MHVNDWMWGVHWGWGALWIVLTIGLLLILAERLRQKPSGNGSNMRRFDDRFESESPIEILRIRYARGDISDEEYLTAKQRLEETGADILSAK